MRRLTLAVLAIFLTVGGLTAVQPRASASGDIAPDASLIRSAAGLTA